VGLAGGTNTPIRINPFHNPPQPKANELRLVDANVAVFAQIGSGKSFLLKLLIRRGLPRGCDYVVVDAEDQKEYRALCDNHGGQYVRLGAGSHIRINPLELPPYDPDDDDLQDPLKDHIGSLLRLLELMLADRGQLLSGDEQAILDLALGATYATTWTDPDGTTRGGFTTDPATHRLERTPLLAYLLRF
jgi:type IV secretory pathway VirB4 component